MPRRETFAARLARLRGAAGLSQRQAARLSGLSQQALSLLERGLRDPTLGTLSALARVLSVDAGCGERPSNPTIREWAGLRVWVAKIVDELGDHAMLAASLVRLLDLCVGYPPGPSRDQLWQSCLRLARFLKEQEKIGAAA